MDKKDKHCQCSYCQRNNRFLKIAHKRKINHKDKAFLLEVLELLVETEGCLELEELRVKQIMESGCLDLDAYREKVIGKDVSNTIKKEKDVLKELWDDLLQAKKGKHEVKVNLLSTLIAEIQAVGKNNGNRETTEEESMVVVKKFLKNTNKTINSLNEKCPNSQHLEGLFEEEKILKSYVVPEESKVGLLEDELTKIINNFIDSLEEKNIKQMGKVMMFLKQNYFEKYDAKIAGEIVNKALL